MSESQMLLIKKYHAATPFYEVPLWVYGLRFAMGTKKYATDFYMPWDYGLGADCQLLCRHRLSGRLPFEFMPSLWEKLQGRKEELSQWSTSLF